MGLEGETHKGHGYGAMVGLCSATTDFFVSTIHKVRKMPSTNRWRYGRWEMERNVSKRERLKDEKLED